MVKTTVKVTGFKEVQENLARLEKLTTQRNVIRKAIDDAAKPMLDSAKDGASSISDAYADTFVQSGKLTKPQERKARKGGKDKSAVYRYVGSTTALAVPIEYGTRKRVNSGMYAGSIHPGTRPYPVMTQAFEGNKERYLQDLKEAMWVHINKALKNQARRQARAAKKKG